MRDPYNWRRHRDTSEHVPQDGSRPHARVDLGLALLAARAKRGVMLTRHDIAAWCGCTDVCIYQIERRAMRKIAQRLTATELGREMRAA